MKLSLHCPACSRPIADHITTQQVACPACQSEFGVVYGKLSRHSSLPETLLYLTAKLPRFYKRHYTLQITTPDRTLKQLQFSLSGKADPVPVHAGDLVSILYTMRGYVMQTLVAITNHTTGKRYVLPNPIPSAGHQVTMLGSGTIALLVGSYLSGTSLFLTSVLSAIGVLLYLKLTHTAQLTSPRLEAQGREGVRLLADQRLIAQQRTIEQRIGELEHDCKANQMLVSQIAALRSKMEALDQRLYANRMTRSQTAIRLIDQQNFNNHRLLREYKRAAKMIEIEVETSWIADQLPDGDDFSGKIIRKLEELRTIEDQNHFLKLQLAAYEELKQE